MNYLILKMDDDYFKMIEYMNSELDLLENMCNDKNIVKSSKTVQCKQCKKCKNIFKAIRNYYNYCSLKCYIHK